MTKFLFVCGAILMAQLFIIGRPYLVIKIRRVDCQSDHVFITNVSCSLKAVNRHKTFATMHADIVNILRNISAHMQLFRKNDVNRYLPFLVNVTENFCDILDRKLFPLYGTMSLRILKAFSNLNHTCPYTGHVFLNNGFVDEPFFRGIPIPTGDYKLVSHVYEGYPYQLAGVATTFATVYDERKPLQSK